MNRKGFTLIELLSAITIMGLIATITSINVMKILDNKKEINESNKDKLIEEAACIYIELDSNKELKNKCLTDGCNIGSDILINEGLLDKDMNNRYVHIYKENNEKICKILEDE